MARSGGGVGAHCGGVAPLTAHRTLAALHTTQKNTTGKTTLLQLLAGKYMVPRDRIVVLGEAPFHDMVRLLV